MALAYGKVPKSYTDPIVLAVNRCLTRLGNNLRPGLWRVDNWPFLRYAPAFLSSLMNQTCWASYVPGYLKELQDGHKEELDLFKSQLNEVREKMVWLVFLTHAHSAVYLSALALIRRVMKKSLSPSASTLLRDKRSLSSRTMRQLILPVACSAQVLILLLLQSVWQSWLRLAILKLQSASGKN